MNFLYTNLKKINPSILIYLIPPALVSGPFLPDFLLVISSIFFLYKIINKKKYYYFNNYFTKIFLLFYSVLILSSLLSDNFLLYLESSLFYFRYLFFSLAVYYCIENYKNFLKKLSYSILATFIILIFDSSIQWLTGQNILGWEIQFEARLTSLFGEEMILGSYLSRMMPIFILCFMYNINYLSKINLLLIFILFFIILGIIFRTGERVALGYMIMLLIYLIFLFRRNIFFFFASITSVIIISIFVISLNPIVKERMINITIKQITDEKKIYTISKFLPYSEHHELHYITAIKMFIDKPILGHGPKLFRIKCKEDIYYMENACATHPHNSYIQLLSETGLIGFSFIFLFFLYLLYKFLKYQFDTTNSNMYRYNSIVYLPILISLFPFFPTGSFFNNWLNVIYYLPLGILLWENKFFLNND